MTVPGITVHAIGREREPLVVLDGFAPDPDRLRRDAAAAVFGPAGEHYPGIRAALPPDYLSGALPGIAAAINRGFRRCRRIEVIDASFSIVTMSPGSLSVKQRLPHVDARGRERIAFIHYLSDDPDGTAFFRHRATGFETVDDARAPADLDRLTAELGDGGDLAPAYIAGDTALFEVTAQAPARYNRALLYRSCLLHSGAISPASPLAADPVTGRLTVTAFLSVR